MIRLNEAYLNHTYSGINFDNIDKPLSNVKFSQLSSTFLEKWYEYLLIQKATTKHLIYEKSTKKDNELLAKKGDSTKEG